jgi:hypothetical protein
VGISGISSIVYSRFRSIILNFYSGLGGLLEGAPTAYTPAVYSSAIEISDPTVLFLAVSAACRMIS